MIREDHDDLGLGLPLDNYKHKNLFYEINREKKRSRLRRPQLHGYDQNDGNERFPLRSTLYPNYKINPGL